MAGSGVTLYSTTSAGNKTVIGTIDWREDVYMPAQINDNVGQIMADIRAMANSVATGWIEIGDGTGTYTATYLSAASFRFDGVDVTGYYRAGMRVRVVAPTPGTIDGTITSSVFSTHTTLVVAFDSGGLSNENITSVSLGIGSGGGAGSQASYRNILGRNGGMEVWQRGAGGSASFSVAGGPLYTADGWSVWGNGGMTVGVLQFGGLVGQSRSAAIVYRQTGQAAGTVYFEFPLDTDEIVPMRGQIVTLSMYMLADAAFTPASKQVTVQLLTGTGAPAKSIAGFTGSVGVISSTANLTTGVVRYIFTSLVTVPVNATQAAVAITWVTVGTAPANDKMYIDDVQLEIGATATAFERRPFESELVACRRHYQKSFDYGVAPVQNGGTQTMWCISQVVAASSGMQTYLAPFGPMMRNTPTITLFNPYATNAQARNVAVAADCTSTAVNISGAGGFNMLTVTPVASAPGNLIGINWTADAGI